MLHYTCDLCGKELRPGDDQRYVVKIEAYAAQDPGELTEADLEEDQLEAISEILREADELADTDLSDPCKCFRYDLCSECHKKYLRDPLGKETSQKLFFSSN